MLSDREALSRTAALLRMDALGGGVDDDPIVAGLRDTTVRVVADHANLQSAAGQTALVTLHNQLVMTGLRVDLDVTDTPIVRAQPPLNGPDLQSALIDYQNDLMPGGSAPSGRSPVLTFALGDTAVPADVRVSGSGFRLHVGPDTDAARMRWRGDNPFGAVAAAAAAACEGVRAAMPTIIDRLDRPINVSPLWSRRPVRPIDWDLSAIVERPPRTNIGIVDVISGGAITQACLYTLLRVPDVIGQFRVIEPDSLDISNLNRYPLARSSQVNIAKTTLLEELSTIDLSISGVRQRFDNETLGALLPLASSVLVGVDHIPSRWLIQRHATGSHLYVGATSHDFVVVSSHPTGEPCAGCTHTRDDPGNGVIPTVGFVSLWAGVLQALHLLTTPSTSTEVTLAWPLGLENRRGLHGYGQQRVAGCPARCR